VQGGVALSLARLNRIVEIARDDFVAVVQPGVITAKLQAEVEQRGLYYPPDPASRADCSLGGNIATNAGGPRCLKYGVTRDYVLGLEVALADGTLVRLGSRTHKNKTGFDLHRLFVGSEGMLGVVTEATLKLIPLPPYRACLGVGFGNMRAAAKALRAIFAAGFLPAALELADEFTLKAAVKRTGSRELVGCGAHMIVELDGQEASVRRELRDLEKAVRSADPKFVRRGLGHAGVERFWGLRREFSYSLRDTGLTKLNEDIVVPRGQLEALFRFTAALQRKHRIPIACFGHAGDGNIHVNVMRDDRDPAQKDRSEACLDELFQGVVKLGGVVTGEHGIGLAKQPWWPLAVSPAADALHRTIKSALDPRGILNPGKFLG
jgi:glycolate oxidase subunit GlcD